MRRMTNWLLLKGRFRLLKLRLRPNSKFANIEDIYQAQLAAEEAESGLDEESYSESLSEAGSCIIVVMN